MDYLQYSTLPYVIAAYPKPVASFPKGRLEVALLSVNVSHVTIHSSIKLRSPACEHPFPFPHPFPKKNLCACVCVGRKTEERKRKRLRACLGARLQARDPHVFLIIVCC